MEFRLPEIGEGVHEGELIRWLVKEGELVQADQALVEVMTDKATVEVPAPVAGKIESFQAKEGDMIKVGQLLAKIQEAQESKATPPPPPPLQNSNPAPAPKSSAPAPQSLPIPPQGASRSPYVSALEAHSAPAIPAAPIVRVMAQKAGVDLAQVSASGPEVAGHRRVLEEDLLRFLNSNPAKQTVTSPLTTASPISAPLSSTSRNVPVSDGLIERKPLRGLRRAISNAMVKSKFTAPHYSYVDEFECSSLVLMREEAKKSAEKFGVKISYLPFIVKAVVSALKEFPQVNASLEEGPEGQTLLLKKFYNIGIAVNTPEGLMVPVIKHADQKSLLEIATEIQELSEKTRAGKASAEDLKGSTFTITSMGNVGGLFATPIINYPEVGIMGVYRIQEKPIVQNSQIVIGKTMHLSLSLDHRVVDGVVGAEFCNAVIARLSQPARLMLEMV